MKSLGYEEDCIEIFFSGKPGCYGQIVANLNTTFERIVSPAGSDISWNPRLNMKGRKFIGPAGDEGGGFFTIEMMMPLSELEQFRGEGGLLTFNVARQNRYLNELSNWVRSSSFHSVNDYAQLVFVENWSGDTAKKLAGTGRSLALSYLLRQKNSKASPQVGVQLIYSDKHDELKLGAMAAGENQFTFFPEQDNFLYSVLITDADRIVYRAPIEQFGEGLTVGRGRFSAGSGSQIFVNGKLSRALEFGLMPGKNTIAVRTNDPTAVCVAIDGQEKLQVNETWKFSRKEVADWNIGAFDDSRWSCRVPSGNGPVFMRKTIIANHSRFYPLLNETEPLSAAAGSVQPFSIIINGIKDEVLTDYRYYLEIPEGIEFIGASGQRGGRYGRARCTWKENGKVMNNGKLYSSYEICFSGNDRQREGIVKYIPSRQLTMEDIVTIAIKPALEYSGRELSCYYYMTANAGNYMELKRRFPVRVLPEFTGAIPRRMRSVTWLSFRQLDDTELQLRIYREHANAGFNIANADNGQAEIIKQTGMKYCSRFNFEPTGFAPVQVLKKYPGIRFKDHAGNEQPVRIPFYHIVHHEELRQDLRRAFAEYLLAGKMDILDWDFEFDSFTGFYSSYDDDTLADFRNRYRIEDDLSPGIIQKKYEKEWVEYMNKLTAGVFEFMHEVTSRHGILLDVYSGYPSEYTKRHYGIDYEFVLPHVDFAMMGYGRPLQQIQEILRLSGKYNKPVIFGICAKPYFLYQEAPQFKITPALVMRRAIDGGSGIMYWGHYCSDGQLLHAFNEVNRLLHEYEDFILDGMRSEKRLIEKVEGIPQEDVVVYEHKGESLLIALNPDVTDRDVIITFRQIPNEPGTEFYSGMSMETTHRQLKLKINSGNIAVVLYKGD